MKRTKVVGATRKEQLEQSRVAIVCQSELVLEAVRRWSTKVRAFAIEDELLRAVFREDGKLAKLERDRQRLVIVRRQRRAKAKAGAPKPARKRPAPPSGGASSSRGSAGAQRPL